MKKIRIKNKVINIYKDI